MKYNTNNKPLVCMMTQSTCYRGTRKMTVKGVLWHSTGANNPNLRRYVQPDDNVPNRAELLRLIGTNNNKNDWNHSYVKAGLNCWIGKLADGTVTTVQTMPWDYKPWGCGSGVHGSCNDNWIQFEICEDGLNDAQYFRKVYEEACELTAYLCKLYGIDPYGTVLYNGIRIPTILCHADSHRLGVGSNHGDVLHWFPKFGKTMENVRADVATLLKGNIEVKEKPASEGTTTDAPSAETPSRQYYRVRRTWEDKKSQKGAYLILENAKKCADDNPGFSVFDLDGKVVYTSTENSGVPFLARVNIPNLNIRGGPGVDYRKTGEFTGIGVFTIMEVKPGSGSQSGWGRLKSGKGWIALDYIERA